MKKLIFALIVVATMVSATLLAFSQDDNQKPYLVKTFDLANGGSLVTKTSGGSIKVTGTSGNQVKVEMFVKPANWRNRNEAPSKEALAKYTFDVRKDGNTVYAVAERKDKNWKWDDDGLNVSFEIQVPERIATKLNTSGGSISLANLTGNQEAKTSGGSISLKNVKGNAVANTSGGSISLTQYQGNLDAETSGGSINLTDARGTLKARTSGGSIQLQKVAGDIDARTSGGSINADVTQLGKYLNLHTSGGSVHATIPKGKGLDLDLSGNRVKTTLTNFDGESETNRVKGTINGGGIPVKLSTSGGTTELAYRM
jgi:hypothetical protein